MRYFFIGNAGFSVLLIILSIPMILGKIRPNVWYGFRTRKTLSDERIWYAANQYAGKTLLFAGIVMIVGSMILYWIASSLEYEPITGDDLLLVLGLMMLCIPIATSVIASFVYLRKLPSE